MIKIRLLPAAILMLFVVAPFGTAAPIVTMTETVLVRTQSQGAGTYRALDFFYSSSAGAEFLNYTLDVAVSSGFLYDPARLQDDRQTSPMAPGQDGNTAGAVDTWANTVMSAAGKIDGGYNATVSANPAFYQPTGSGAAPGFTRLQWDVFDTEQFDDNDLTDHPAGIFTSMSKAPYHIARVLASMDAVGSASFNAFDSSALGVGTLFTGWGGIQDTPPVVDPEPANLEPLRQGDIVNTQFTATDPQSPPHVLAFSNAQLASYVPMFPGAPIPAFNGTVDIAGNFTWDTTGFGAGVYTINVVATDPQGLSSTPGGHYVVTIYVPEPSTTILFGFAVGGALMMRNGSRKPVGKTLFPRW
jgi:hypothetical protein